MKIIKYPKTWRQDKMTTIDENKIYKDALEIFGATSQKIMLLEEMSELTKELCKELRDRGNIDNIAEEVADVEIVLAQIKQIYNISDKVKEQKNYKLHRFSQRMAEIRSKPNK